MPAFQGQTPQGMGQAVRFDAAPFAGQQLRKRRSEPLAQAKVTALTKQQRWTGQGELWPRLGPKSLLHFALDAVVEHARVWVGAQGADHQQMARTEFTGAPGKGDDQFEVDGAKSTP